MLPIWFSSVSQILMLASTARCPSMPTFFLPYSPLPNLLTKILMFTAYYNIALYTRLSMLYCLHWRLWHNSALWWVIQLGTYGTVLPWSLLGLQIHLKSVSWQPQAWEFPQSPQLHWKISAIHIGTHLIPWWRHWLQFVLLVLNTHQPTTKTFSKLSSGYTWMVLLSHSGWTGHSHTPVISSPLSFCTTFTDSLGITMSSGVLSWWELMNWNFIFLLSSPQ